MVRTLAYRIFLVGIIVILTVVGIFVGLQISKNKSEQEAINVVNNNGNTDVEKENEGNEQVDIYTPTISKTYDIELVYEDYYSLCKETVINKNVVYGITLEELKEKEKEKQEKLGEIYEISEESNTKLVYKRTINKYCPNHFKVLVNNEESMVVIYQLEDKKNSNKYQQIEIYKETLREELLNELKDGIEVNSKKELNLIIEDIES